MRMVSFLQTPCMSLSNDHIHETLRVPSSLPPLHCWDGILSPDKTLPKVLSAVKSRKHSFTSIINRKSPPRSIIECALQSILSQLNDDSPYLEYWVRNPSSHPRSLEAHRDIDEGFCTKHASPISIGSDVKIGQQRCPNNGHVLYIDVKGPIGSPTLIWDEVGGAAPGPPRQITSVWTVPSVGNRLLRFDGNCLHAVAYPPLSFLNECNKYDNHTSGMVDASCPGKRAVILFNTWDEPPMYPTAGEDLSIGETNLHSSFMSDEVISCQSFSSWSSTPITNLASSSTRNAVINMSLLSVPLLGDYLRRGCEASSLDMFVNEEQAKMALTSRHGIMGVEVLNQ